MEKIYLNDDWLFKGEFSEEYLTKSAEESDFEQVRLPHTCKELPLHYFSEQDYQMISTYRRHLFVPKEWENQKLILTIDGACHSATLYVNGKEIGSHHSGYTAFIADLTDAVIYGEENLLVIKVDSRESLNIPPFGFVVDYMTYGGITRDVYLEVKNQEHIQDVFIKYDIVSMENMQATVSMKSEIVLERISQEPVQVVQTLCDGNQVVAEFSCTVEGNRLTIPNWTTKVQLWDIENPKLYLLKTRCCSKDAMLDEWEQTIGFRKAEFRENGFYLNGRKVKIRGLNRHQSYPYVGYAMPESMQRLDADILKKELGCNAVRTSHYPQSHYFIDQCDQLGLLVFMEFPGWQHIGDEEWKQQALRNEKEMIEQYRNHTSIILWGVRINESKDDESFYRRTNALAHELDDTRPTGGVRAHKKSQFFEDVYTYNDFVHSGKNMGCEPKKNVATDGSKPYLVSEYNGHMYPTKSYDAEEHRVEHALRHANVLDEIANQEDICGSFGWCMFDYNTHKDFGSGDRICYHGVMDMFRNPKLAALIYACQQEEYPVLELSSSMDIGEHPACNRGYTYIISNADSVRMYKNDKFIKEYQSSESIYKHLKHGPILVNDFIGDEIVKNEPTFTAKQSQIIKDGLNYTAMNGYGKFPLKIMLGMLRCILFNHMKIEDSVVLYNKYIGDWGGTSTVYKFEAVKNGKVVKTIVKEPAHQIHLRVNASSQELVEGNSYDVSELRIQVVDQNENQLYFYQEPLEIKVEGAAKLIGPSVISANGGMTGAYIKSIGVEGPVKVTIQNSQLQPVEVNLTVKKK